MSDATTTTSSDDAKIRHVNVYQLYTPRQRALILLAGAFLAILTPFTDTIYLPALKSVAEDYDASDSIVALTVSIYLACVGVGQLLWGPLSDRFGRLPILSLSLIIYEGITIGCIFSPNITTFLVLRSLQGFIVGSTIIVAQAVVSDVFPPAERGEAMGSFLAPMLIGPVIAPLIGGALSQSFGWRSTFMALAVLGAPTMAITFMFITETHHYFVHMSLSGKLRHVQAGGSTPQGTGYDAVGTGGDKETAGDIDNNGVELVPISDKGEKTREESGIAPYSKEAAIALSTWLSQSHKHVVMVSRGHEIPEPEFQMPWSALSICFEPDFAPFIYELSVAFAMMFSSLTLAPLWLVEDPYGLSETIVGVTFLAIGFGMLLGALHGGRVSDQSAERFEGVVEGRMLYTQYFTPLVPLGALAFAYALKAGANIGYVLVSQFVLGYGQSAIMSGTIAYLTALRPSAAAAASAVMMCLCFSFAAVCVASSVVASDVIGIDGFFWVLTGFYALSVAGSIFMIYRGFQKAKPFTKAAREEKEGEETAVVVIENSV